MNHYYVMSPEYDEVCPILDDGTGPIETGRDVVEVDASNKREAAKLGYQQLKKMKWYCREYERDKHPYAYLTVESLEDIGGEQ